MREDFPTLLRPIKAYSGKGELGHLVTSELLTIKVELLIFITTALEISLLKPGMQNRIELVWMLHHGRMTAFIDPE